MTYRLAVANEKGGVGKTTTVINVAGACRWISGYPRRWDSNRECFADACRIKVSTVVYLLLAAFAAPPVRSYLQQKSGLTFPRSIVVGVLIAGVLINEDVVPPPVEEPAIIIACVIPPL